MKNCDGNSKTEILLKITLIFVLSVLSFSIGAFVGKQVSDTEHRQAMLESEFTSERGLASVNPSSLKPAQPKQLDEIELASLTKEFLDIERKSRQNEKKEASSHQENEIEVRTMDDPSSEYKKYGKKSSSRKFKGDVPEIQKEALSKSQASKPILSKELDKPSAASKRVAQGKAPGRDPVSIDVQPQKRPSNLPISPSSAIGKYTIQIASYSTEKEAISHAEALLAKGYQAHYFPALANGKEWFRVSIGLFPDRNSASNHLKEIMAEIGSDSFVQKISRSPAGKTP